MLPFDDDDSHDDATLAGGRIQRLVRSLDDARAQRPDHEPRSLLGELRSLRPRVAVTAAPCRPTRGLWF
jgi:hypothetical protein